MNPRPSSRRRSFFAAALVAFAAARSAAAAPEAPIAEVTGGAIRGVPYGPGAAFLGIPFAAPPIGPLRWSPPAPVPSWPGVRDATTPPFDGWQPDEGWNHAMVIHASEDCLYLNVVTPRWPMEGQLPVIVFVHGGGNFAGGGWEHPAIGVMLQEQGLVLVTVNYRLGIFGFFSHPGLTAESPHHASGNYALMDVRAALVWVRNNISRFGGDPESVCLMGQSAGALDICLLMASPGARGLFAKAIVESSPGVGAARTPGLRAAEDQGAAIASSLGCATVEGLRAVPARDLLAAAEARHLRGGVVVDGWVLTESPAKTFAAGREARIPLVIGTNARESSFKGTEDELRKEIDDRYGALAPKAEALYLGPDATAADPTLGDAGARYLTDTVFRLPSLLVAQWHAATGAPTWVYLFSQVPKGREGRGASHSSELAYTFGEMRSPPPGVTYGAQDRAASLEMQRLWSNFAARGDPNAAALQAWPPFDPATQTYLEILGNGSAVGHDLRAPFLALYRPLYLGELTR
jgi:para-nitrobenzyl esterase